MLNSHFIFRQVYQNDELPMLMSMYLSVLSRILLSSHDIFTQTINRLAQMNNTSEQHVLTTIMDVWLTKMCHVSQLEQRKLLGLALTNLLTTQSRAVLERFGNIMLNLVETLNDLTKQDDSGIMTDSLVLTEGQSPSYFQEDSGSYYETDHEQRMKQLILSDPVHTIVLKDYLQSQVLVNLMRKLLFSMLRFCLQLMELKKQVSPTQYDHLVQLVDREILSQLKEYVLI